MTKYLTDERFIVHSNTKEAQQNYLNNYDRIFGEPEERVGVGPNVVIVESGFDEAVKKESELTRECGCPGAVVRNCPYQGDVNNNEDQRCKCCDACAHSCAMDI